MTNYTEYAAAAALLAIYYIYEYWPVTLSVIFLGVIVMTVISATDRKNS
jgi:hypothetical protein